MSFILLLLTVAIFIVLEIVKTSRSKRVSREKTLLVEGEVSSPVIERYFHPGHSWVLVGKAGPIVVGVDDFAQRFIGQLDGIDLPVVGKKLNQGDVLAKLHRRGRSLVHVAPLSGTVIAVNEKLARRPALVNESPYDRGWTVKIAPTSLRSELRNLLRGTVAERWMEAVRIELVHWFSPRLGTVLQDGGGLVESVSDLVGAEEWERLVAEFFPLVISTRNNPQP